MTNQGAKPPVARFYTTEQFRDLKDGAFQPELAGSICILEAMQPGTDLKTFLKKEVLFGNKGQLNVLEMRDLARELFVSERSAGYLAQLRSDNCLGYTKDEEDAIIALLETPFSNALDIALLLGYMPPRRRV